ncbi:MAG: DNA repair protein RadA [Flavobacteriales bacterium]
MSVKNKTLFYCQSCGFQSPKWLGKCPSCNAWNSFAEERVTKADRQPAWDKETLVKRKENRPVLLTEVEESQLSRLIMPGKEFNRVLGGGVVPGSLILLGGEPGIGKSTLLLQLATKLKNHKVLYVSGEESEQQIKMRAQRIGIGNELCYVMAETSIDHIFRHISDVEPALLIIDSIQTLYTDKIESSPGSVSQIRECTAELMRFAKETNTPVILIGHITKDGQIAGPKVLEHMVDCVLQFEGDRNHVYRLVRATKNRFGSTSEIGIYEMVGSGLREVNNPSEVLLSELDGAHSGITISATLEGARPMLVESQALVSSAVYGTPQRSSTGFDLRRLNMLLAVIEKRCGFRLGAKDVFLNITGGIRIDDPAVDLGVVCAILSSNEDIPISSKICFAAEVGLSGEIRPVSRIDTRIAEADKLGFDKVIISSYNLKNLDTKSFQTEIVSMSKIEEVFRYLFG